MDLQPASMRRAFYLLPLLVLVSHYSALVAAIPPPVEPIAASDKFLAANAIVPIVPEDEFNGVVDHHEEFADELSRKDLSSPSSSDDLISADIDSPSKLPLNLVEDAIVPEDGANGVVDHHDAFADELSRKDLSSPSTSEHTSKASELVARYETDWNGHSLNGNRKKFVTGDCFVRLQENACGSQKNHQYNGHALPWDDDGTQMRGWVAKFGEGSYDMHTMYKAEHSDTHYNTAYGARNDEATCIYVPDCCQAELYEHDWFKGRKEVMQWTNGNTWALDHNDWASSLKVTKGPCKAQDTRKRSQGKGIYGR